MKVGLIADIHCNVEGLRAALECLTDTDIVYCAGDAVYEYSFSNEVFDVLCDRGVKMVLGNHESIILSHAGARVRATADQRHLDYIAELPEVLEQEVAGKSLYMVHGSPWNHVNEYLFPTSARLAKLDEVGTDFIVLGHTHYPMVRRIGSSLVINPGSCGETRDHRLNGELHCAVLDTETEEAQIIGVRGGRALDLSLLPQ